MLSVASALSFSTFHDFDFFFGQAVKLVHHLVDLPLPRGCIRLRIGALSYKHELYKSFDAFLLLSKDWSHQFNLFAGTQSQQDYIM